MSSPEVPDLSQILAQAQQMQQQLAEAQQQLADEVVEGHSGGGAVRVSVTGAMEFREVHIRPDAVDPDDVDMLEDLVLAALHDAVAQVQALNQQAMGGLGGLAGLMP
jgi:DNA-binding YbaB/EbfC family protein